MLPLLEFFIGCRGQIPACSDKEDSSRLAWTLQSEERHSFKWEELGG